MDHSLRSPPSYTWFSVVVGRAKNSGVMCLPLMFYLVLHNIVAAFKFVACKKYTVWTVGLINRIKTKLKTLEAALGMRPFWHLSCKLAMVWDDHNIYCSPLSLPSFANSLGGQGAVTVLAQVWTSIKMYVHLARHVKHILYVQSSKFLQRQLCSYCSYIRVAFYC